LSTCLFLEVYIAAFRFISVSELSYIPMLAFTYNRRSFRSTWCTSS